MKPLILFDHEIFTIQKFGGISRVFIELINGLSSDDNFRVAWHRGNYLSSHNIAHFHYRLDSYSGNPAGDYIGVNELREINYRSLEAFVEKIGPVDILHPTYYSPEIIDLVPHKKLVITIHDMIPEILMSEDPKVQQIIQGKSILIKQADLIFADSENTALDLKKYYPDVKDKILINPLGCSLDNIVAEDLPLSFEVTKKPFFLYVGTRTKYKNFQCLLDAFVANKELREKYTVIVFGGSGEFNKSELKFLKENDLMDSFFYLYGGDGVLKTLYRKALALVYTSNYEGFGLPILEAMRNSCHVVCCKTSSIPEIIQDAATYFEKNNALDLAQKLIRVHDSEAVSEMVKVAKIRSNAFSWGDHILKAKQAYQSLLV
jgi:glycosyltransferase involved in cell wall biosynthesis